MIIALILKLTNFMFLVLQKMFSRFDIVVLAAKQVVELFENRSEKKQE